MNHDNYVYSVTRCSHCKNAILSDQEDCILSFCLSERDALALHDSILFLQEPSIFKSSIVPDSGFFSVPAPFPLPFHQFANDDDFAQFLKSVHE